MIARLWCTILGHRWGATTISVHGGRRYRTCTRCATSHWFDR